MLGERWGRGNHSHGILWRWEAMTRVSMLLRQSPRYCALPRSVPCRASPTPIDLRRALKLPPWPTSVQGQPAQTRRVGRSPGEPDGGIEEPALGIADHRPAAEAGAVPGGRMTEFRQPSRCRDDEAGTGRSRRCRWGGDRRDWRSRGSAAGPSTIRPVGSATSREAGQRQ